MNQKHWRALGFAIVLCAGVSVLAAAIETLAVASAHRADLSDYMFALNIHFLMGLAVCLALRALLWRLADRFFPWVALGAFLVCELVIILGFWINSAAWMPPFRTSTGKLAALGVAAAGAVGGLALALLVWRLAGQRRATQWVQGKAAQAGLVLGIVLLLLNAGLIWRAIPGRQHVYQRPGSNQVGRPNVIVVLIDALRRDHMSFWGYPRPTSPNLDRFLRESFAFEQAYTPSNWTVTSVASIFTGMYPTSHGVYGDQSRIPNLALTLAEHFQTYDYCTGAFVANPIVDEQHGFAQGFETFFPEPPLWWTYHGRTAVERIGRRLMGATETSTWRIPVTAKINRRFFRWLDGDTRRPRFAYIHYLDPHGPYEPPEALREAVAPGAPPGPPETPAFLDYSQSLDCRDWRCLENPPQLAATALTGMVANYDGEIRYTDQLFGELLDGLRKRGLLETSHLLLLTDHGEEFFDHQGWRHSYSIYEEVSGAVMAYRPPGGLPGGRIVHRPVATIDLTRTLLDVLGLEQPPHQQGRSIPEITGVGEPSQGTGVLCELPPYLFSLRMGDWKLIRRGPVSEPVWELYNVSRDPSEQSDLAAAAPDTLVRVRDLLEALLLGLSRDSLGETESIKDPEALDRLRALGYIQ